MKTLKVAILMIFLAISSPLLAQGGEGEDDESYTNVVEQQRLGLQQLQPSVQLQQQQEQRRIELAPGHADASSAVPDNFYAIPGNFLGSGNFYYDSLNLNQPLEVTIIPRAGSNPIRNERDIDRSSYNQLPSQYEKY